ncbi:MAG: hypothetical protein EU530_05970 [Promethearchaeota archaeon]|nr:MAG: hypothetical protein EU530_05970 [Candidatus Lokiarchaeota archaeon]
MEIHKNGLFIEEKLLSYKDKCAVCRSRLYLQVYHYNGGLRKVVSCKKCNTYSEIKKPKKYVTDIKEIQKPSFLQDKKSEKNS